MRAGIAARLRALDGAPATRMNIWRLGAEYRVLFRLTGELHAAVAAAERFAEAATLDESWPMPVVDLAELASEVQLADELLGHPDPLLARVAAQDIEGSFEVATTRSLSNREFEHRVLGGRSDAYVVQDAPALLASALVFKPMSTLQATRERQTAIHLDSALTDAALQGRFTCIRSLAIVPLQPDDPRRKGQIDCVHVLGREDGTSLAELALRAAHRGRAVEDPILDSVVDFLALFHASYPLGDADAYRAARRDWRLSLRTWLRTLLGNERALSLRDTWERSIVAGLPTFPKRDAHPGNWLVTGAAAVVALDLECASHLPVLMEVAQLVEDGPCVPADDGGWARRDDICRRYLSEGRILAQRFAYLEPDPTLRRARVDRWNEMYSLRSTIAHGGEASRALEAFSVRDVAAEVVWTAKRLRAFAAEFHVSSEADFESVGERLRLGEVSWRPVVQQGGSVDNGSGSGSESVVDGPCASPGHSD